MEREVGGEGRFFKVMLPGFHKKLNLPRAFCKKLEEEDEPEGAILESRKGKWEIGTLRNSEGVICFGDGWPEFARRHDLSVGDFVVFEHTGELRFNVVVFGRNACEKEFPVGSKIEAIEAGESKEKSDKKSDVSYHNKDPYFILTMTPYLAAIKAQPTVPMGFVRSNDLGKKTSASLRNPAGKIWAVRFSAHRSPFRCRMGSGWHGFYVSNELKDGDVCVFVLVLDRSSRASSITVSFDVKIFRSPGSKLMLYPTV